MSRPNQPELMTNAEGVPYRSDVTLALFGTREYFTGVDDSLHLVQHSLPIAVGMIDGSIDPHQDHILMDVVLGFSRVWFA
jgi:hypothetical protein